MKKIILVITLSCLSTTVYAQFIEDAPFSYSFTPTNGTVGIQRATASVPLGKFSLGEQRGALFLAGSYTYSALSFDNNRYPSVATSKLEHVHNINLIAGYRRPLNERWNLLGLAVPYIASDLRSGLGERDFRGVGLLAFQRINKAKTDFLSLGLVYATDLPVPIPIASYRHIINDRWEYTLGVPRSELNYSVIEGGTIKSFLKVETLEGNVSTPVLPNQEDDEVQLSKEALIGGLGYTHKLGERIGISLEGGYSLYNQFMIENYDNDKLYDFDIDNKLYFNIGFDVDL